MGCETKRHKRVPCGLGMGFSMVPIWVNPTKYLATPSLGAAGGQLTALQWHGIMIVCVL